MTAIPVTVTFLGLTGRKEIVQCSKPLEFWGGGEVIDLALTMVAILGLEAESAGLMLWERWGRAVIGVHDHATMGQWLTCETPELALSAAVIDEAHALCPDNRFVLGEAIESSQLEQLRRVERD
jgi:hypothetical protein